MFKLLVGCAFLVGCQTTFEGSAHIDPGRCQAKCAQSGLVMSGMVYMGEYSSACVCDVPRTPPAETAPTTTPPSASAGGAGAAVGVIMQMRRAAQQQQAGR